MDFKIGQLQDLEHAVSNKVYLNPADYAQLLTQNGQREPVYVKIKNYVFTLAPARYLEKGSAGLNKKQRLFLKLSQTLDKVQLLIFPLPTTEYRLSLLKVEITPVDVDNARELADEQLEKVFKQLYMNQFFQRDQEVFFELEGQNYFGKIADLLLVDSLAKKQDLPYGMVGNETEFEFSARGSRLRIKNKSNKLKTIFRPDFKFEDMGVGGMDKEIGEIFRRAFSSRRIPNHILEMYGNKHVKGLLLYGPPGTGKTLIARQLAKVLHAKEPKIVNGPELFNKYVGETESNVRKLFDDAKKDQLMLKEDSPLHVIIFDEFDAIAKHRGADASGTGVGDNIVNQLLSMIDGVEALDNILVIGMTNRIDLIDKAVLRPGRFEVHIEVGLPDEAGRVQILQIHTKQMRSNGLMGADVDLAKLAAVLKNYTGAEIEAVVKSANSFALNRHHHLMNFAQKVVITQPGKVELADFLQAIEEVRPEYGVDNRKIEIFTKDPLLDFGRKLGTLLTSTGTLLKEVAKGSLPLASLLIYGAHGTGKTTLAANIAIRSNFPFIKFVSSEDLIGKSEFYKTNFLIKCFDDAYKSSQSIIILDDLEKLIEYVEVGRRFNNNVLQALMVLIKKRPEKTDHSIAIIATSSNTEFLREFAFFGEFNVKLEVQELSLNAQGDNEIANVIKEKLGVKINNTLNQKPSFRIPIKRLLFILSMIQKDLSTAPFENLFANALRFVGNDAGIDDGLSASTF